MNASTSSNIPPSKSKALATLFAFTLLLLIWGKVQSGLKSAPQIVLFFVALLAFGASFFRMRWPFQVLFYFLFGVMLFAGWMEMGQWILDYLAPRRGMVLVDGKWKGLNGDPYWMLELLLSGILSLGLLLFYGRKVKRSLQIERAFLMIFTLLCGALWLVFEA